MWRMRQKPGVRKSGCGRKEEEGTQINDSVRNQEEEVWSRRKIREAGLTQPIILKVIATTLFHAQVTLTDASSLFLNCFQCIPLRMIMYSSSHQYTPLVHGHHTHIHSLTFLNLDPVPFLPTGTLLPVYNNLYSTAGIRVLCCHNLMQL